MKFDEIIVGGTLEAVLHAFVKNKPLIFINRKKPFRFDCFPPGTKLPFFKGELREEVFRTRTAEKIVGTPKKLLYEQICFVMSLAGLIPFEDKVSSLMIEEDNILKITTNDYKVYRVEYANLCIFDDENINGLPLPVSEGSKLKVIDWINVRSGMKHEYDYFYTGDNFIKEIYFYPSDRIDGKHLDRKDAVAISYMTKEQLEDDDYSELYARFKVQNLMKDAGIRGKSNGWSAYNPSKKAYHSLKIETNYRESVSVERNIYENIESINFNYKTADEILQLHSEEDFYSRKINNLLF